MLATRSAVTLALALILGFALPVVGYAVDFAEFVALTPCRVLDTRSGAPLVGGVVTTVSISGSCGVATNVVGAALNFTVVQPVAAGHLTVFPAGAAAPLASLVNYVAGQTIANDADLATGQGGAISVKSSTTTHLVIDVYGYFANAEELPFQNTAVGDGALANVDGPPSFVAPTSNTAVGFRAAHKLSSDSDKNVVVGANALSSLVHSWNNVAIGAFSLGSPTAGSGNVAIGAEALIHASGGANIAIGNEAGWDLWNGSVNIFIGSPGVDGDSGTIRIGRTAHTRTFIAGISNTPLAGDPVVVTAAGQLGTGGAPSSGRVKDDIRDMAGASQDLLKLRPVTFRYKAEHSDGQRLLQYGLIAEEVAEVYPELVVKDQQGNPISVRYHVLPAMLLSEVQKQHVQLQTQQAYIQRQDAAFQARLEAQQREIDELRAQVRALVDARAAIRE